MGVMKIGKSLMNSLFAEPETSKYPEGGLKLSKASRGSIVIDEEACTLCRLCGRRCPSGAIKPDRSQSRIMIDRMKCLVCGECVEECPEHALSMAREYVSPDPSVLVDVYRASARVGSDSVLQGIEMPPEEIVSSEEKIPAVSTKEVQRIKRKKKNKKKKKKRNKKRNKPN